MVLLILPPIITQKEVWKVASSVLKNMKCGFLFFHTILRLMCANIQVTELLHGFASLPSINEYICEDHEVTFATEIFHWFPS